MIEERNVNQMLAEGSFREGEYSGHFQDLISFLAHCKEIDYSRAIGRLAAVERVSGKWVSYFETSIASLSLGPSRQLNLLKGVYLYKVFILLTANGLHLSEVCERTIIKEIGGLSVRLGIQFLPRLHSTSLKIRYIKLLLSKLS